MNDWHVSADYRRLACLDDRRGAEVEGTDVREDPDSSYGERARKCYDDDAQMGPAVSAVHGMVHCRLRSPYRFVAVAGLMVQLTSLSGPAHTAAERRFTEA